MNREFGLDEAALMVPLVQPILLDVAAATRDLDAARQQFELVRDCRLSRRYDVRQQFYLVQKRFQAVQYRLVQLEEELNDLGVLLIDPREAIAGFPFLWSLKEDSDAVREALFLLKASDGQSAGIHRWCFAGERKEREIPPHWIEQHAGQASAQA